MHSQFSPLDIYKLDKKIIDLEFRLHQKEMEIHILNFKLDMKTLAEQEAKRITAEWQSLVNIG